jgi:hypothetical protein
MGKQCGKLFVFIDGTKLFTQPHTEILLAQRQARDTGSFFRESSMIWGCSDMCSSSTGDFLHLTHCIPLCLAFRTFTNSIHYSSEAKVANSNSPLLALSTVPVENR